MYKELCMRVVFFVFYKCRLYESIMSQSIQDREISPEGEISPSCMDWLIMDSFSSTFKWIVPSPALSCEMEVSHMSKKPISYRQRWEKKSLLVTGRVVCGW